MGNPSFEVASDYFKPIVKGSYWDRHRKEVKDAFVTSWDAYVKYAWGRLIQLLLLYFSQPARALCTGSAGSSVPRK